MSCAVFPAGPLSPELLIMLRFAVQLGTPAGLRPSSVKTPAGCATKQKIKSTKIRTRLAVLGSQAEALYGLFAERMLLVGAVRSSSPAYGTNSRPLWHRRTKGSVMLWLVKRAGKKQTRPCTAPSCRKFGSLKPHCYCAEDAKDSSSTADRKKRAKGRKVILTTEA